MQTFIRSCLVAACCAMIGLAGCRSPAIDVRPDNYDMALLSAFEFAPEVRSILDAGGHDAHMGFNYLKYATALRAGGEALDSIVAPGVKLHDLEPRGFKGLEGLKDFRKGQNAALQVDRAVIQSMRFPAADITEIELSTERTVRDTGSKVAYVIHARDRWENDKVVERWHRVENLPPGSTCKT